MNRFLQILANFGTARLLAMTAIVLGIIGFFFFVSMRLSQPQMSLLYADLDIAESGRITERLDTMKVPYRLEDGGRTILVPADRVAKLRVALAGEGLGGHVVGYEIFDRSEGLGTTSFVQRINRLRAIEGELARTIQEIKSVRAARVHIVMPERELFSQTAPEPSASIILRTTTRLSAEQVAAIEHLVAAAVPGLSPSRISIVDQNGTLLARGSDDSGDAAAATLDEKRRSLETLFRRRIEALLEKALGPGRVRAQVAVELDPNAATINEEIYDPDAAVVRSTRTIEETASERKPGETLVSVDTNLPGNQPATTAAQNLNQTQKTDETVNYEISRTVRTLVKERGTIQRISAAVLVDGHHSKNEAGEDVFAPLSDDEIEKLAALVRSAIGYDANRGDKVEVISMPFVEPEIEPVEIEQPFRLFGLNKEDLYRIVEVGVFGIVAIFVLLLVVRPLVNRLVQAIPEATPAPQLAGPAGEALPAGDVEGAARLPGEAAGALPGPAGAAVGATGAGGGDVVAVGGQGGAVSTEDVEEQIQESTIRKVGEIVSKHPDEATAIIRTWLYAEE